MASAVYPVVLFRDRMVPNCLIQIQLQQLTDSSYRVQYTPFLHKLQEVNCLYDGEPPVVVSVFLLRSSARTSLYLSRRVSVYLHDFSHAALEITFPAH